MSLSQLLLTNACVIAGLMLVLWMISFPLRNVSIVDLFWGLGFVLVAWTSFFSIDASTPRSITLVACTTIWGVRLSGYLAWRNLGKPEDFRYAEMRSRNGAFFAWTSLLFVFGLQGVVMWVVALPIQTGQLLELSVPPGNLYFLGLLIWLIGLSCESIADFQLAQFKSDVENAGKIMDQGLWKYTRHPNYFGDFLVWWGLYLISFGNGQMSWSIIGPCVMSLFLMRISGVTLLEKSLVINKPGYETYMKRTSSFFPFPPRHSN